MQHRNNINSELEIFLKSEGFETSNIYDHGAFDIVARKNLLILLVKTFKNIDGVNKTNSEEMKQLASIFLASPLIIGETSRNGKLEDGVIYERYEIPTITLNTFKHMVLYDEYPEIIADRGGYFVKINGNVLKEYRDKYSLSLKELADLAHVSRATMYKYENDMVKVNIETAMLLEKILNEKITVDINLLKPTENSENLKYSDDENTKILSKLGYGVISTNKSPFDAAARIENKGSAPLIANIEKNRTPKTLEKMAVPLKDLSLVTSSDSVFIVDNEKISDLIGEIPVIKSWELNEFENSKDLLKLIKERKE
ncbi:transcriptional regulator [uncultured Methanobrevibacter sp.]|uniref:transcriptional regulator n=1 Tax=uncultured Methanobrevibacter sp. TaxID=253161 RepID=UPI0026DEF5AF|nr:transcriptional regulator [uncultured Methanobrevibacter sp.]